MVGGADGLFFYATKDKSTVAGRFIMCSTILDYRRLVYSCQQPNLYNRIRNI
nr:MAG TPA: hypothetical protein [Caudoviricetes sp.]DAJ19800.1 MAG TPA: hypothetical protein [Siphoviridae sp. cthBp9]